MSNSQKSKEQEGITQVLYAPDDPVLSHLHSAEELYKELRSDAEQQRSELEKARESNKALNEQVESLRRQIDQQKKKADMQKERAKQLSCCLQDMHRALFDGNLYSLILKACLTVTGGTRGLYITARGTRDRMAVRAAIDIDGYPQAQPSEFVKALCHKALDENDTVVCNKDDLSGLPEPSRPSEQFNNCIVAPVVLLKNFDGIVIVADKLRGDFDEEDVETVLSVGDQAAVAVENVRLHRELQGAYLSTVSMLADAVEAKDPNTHGHCEMVSRYARLTSERLGLTDYDRSLVCYAALLHDVGKIGVSDGILNKPGPLLPEERELVRAHVRVGHDLICKVPALDAVADVVLHHHEWYDGTGYPDGLKGEVIPMAARIVCVVDSYCAMITKRSYKEAYTHERARAELTRCSGTQFDPKVVQAFLEMLDSGESYDMDDDDAAECGVLPGFTHIRELQQAIY
jgi:putative nucleotidyltransferase with HDIG domain